MLVPAEPLIPTYHRLLQLCSYLLEVGPACVHHNTHEIAAQPSHSVDRTGREAKMASIEFWIPWRNAHKPHCLHQCLSEPLFSYRRASLADGVVVSKRAMLKPVNMSLFVERCLTPDYHHRPEIKVRALLPDVQVSLLPFICPLLKDGSLPHNILLNTLGEADYWYVFWRLTREHQITLLYSVQRQKSGLY